MDQDAEEPGFFGMESAPAAAAPEPAAAYRVLARKYRPSRFSDMIGQEAMVRTLTNAIATGRLAHAWILTGVRGIGKTTTARIIARALNCTGADGKGGPTPEPCGACPSCVSITGDRNLDVIEIDAASNTGVDNIREIIEGVRYAPVSTRYKIYIIDEVHMLSKNAFNALLKTLEEPPTHAKFIFATTEIRKVPITVLSRCQRFDLRRIDAATLLAHFKRICGIEQVKAEDDALALIARAADGSVRDGLSLLDQAISRAGDGEILAADIRAMMGLGDRDRMFVLFRAVAAGAMTDMLTEMDRMQADGADPLSLLQDIAEIIHLLTRVKIMPGLADDPATPEIERSLLRENAGQLSIPALSRLWQMVLKGIAETQSSAQPAIAAEMALIRLCYAAQLPTPAEIIRSLQNDAPSAAGQFPPAGEIKPTMTSASSPPASSNMAAPRPTIRSEPASNGATALAVTQPAAVAHAPQPDPQPEIDLSEFPNLVQLFADMREGTLHALLFANTHLVRLEPGRLEIRLDEHTPANFSAQIAKYLTQWTGQRWIVTVTGQGGALTLKEQQALQRQEILKRAEAHPLVSAALLEFPGAKITGVKPRPAAAEAVPEISDEAEVQSDLALDFGDL